MNALHDLPIIKDRTVFNLARWAELCADPLWVEIDGKIETDRYGQIIMNPPCEGSAGGFMMIWPYRSVSILPSISTQRGSAQSSAQRARLNTVRSLMIGRSCRAFMARCQGVTADAGVQALLKVAT